MTLLLKHIIDEVHGGISLRVLCFLLLSLGAAQRLDAKVYQNPISFIKNEFRGRLPKARVIVLNTSLQARISRMNGRRYAESRVRYWSEGGKTVYILSDIGKTMPITIGYVVESGTILSVKVLIYRESHGSEVARSVFTRQFKSLKLTSRGRLSRTPSNMAGATLSVRTLSRMARVALFLDSKK